MSRFRRSSLAALLAALGLFVTAGPATADDRTVGTVEEAWYQPCALPVGCEALPASSSYPPQTFHVGLDAGAETARTYLQLDLDALPADADLTGGTLRLPLAEADAGTAAPENASMVACLAPDPVEPVEGSFAPPPELDCDVTAPARLDASAEAFTVDLAAFASSWTPGGVAAVGLVPAPGAQGSWRVVVSGPERDVDGAMPPTASLTFEVADGDEDAAVPSAPPPTASAAPGGPVSEVALPDVTPPAPTFGLPDAEPAAPIAAPRIADAPVAPAVATGGGAFIYAGVWLVPLALLVVGGALGSVLTRPIRVTRRSA